MSRTTVGGTMSPDLGSRADGGSVHRFGLIALQDRLVPSLRGAACTAYPDSRRTRRRIRRVVVVVEGRLHWRSGPYRSWQEHTGATSISVKCKNGSGSSNLSRSLAGDPEGIRTLDLHRDRVACLTATPRGHTELPSGTDIYTRGAWERQGLSGQLPSPLRRVDPPPRPSAFAQ